jgi:glutamate-ammonia-ligase adenylyltransferase
MLPLYFLDTVAHLPAPLRKEDADRGFASLKSKLGQSQDASLTEQIEAIVAHPQGHALLASIFGHSPFLTRLIIQLPDFFAAICTQGVDVCFNELKASFETYRASFVTELMKTLRIAKGKASLLIAIADITGLWSLQQITSAMSEIAERCTQLTLVFLLKQAAAKGDIILHSEEEPARHCGLFVLAMGKLGARELNYSSDIDLIVFFDPDRVKCRDSQQTQAIFTKLTREMVRILQERTMDGYVFRVDLRLRPDPSSTPLALSIAAAISYYETVGQNWERAAFIKARTIAGDLEAGYQFLSQIGPFLWRKHLDFAAIADIQSIKRQMDAQKSAAIDLPGHNIKTGLGGIREIEFFAQIHQLIWGGRLPLLRISGTCETLLALANAAIIEGTLAEKLINSYRFLRTVEHRLQMVDDQQTHILPTTTEGRAKLAAFMGYADVKTFEAVLLEHLNFVHVNFSESFRGNTGLGSDEGTLSFTGVENNPQTLETIRKMGYENPASVSEAIQGWHRGSKRSTRTQRARELITELTPTLLKAFAETSHPDPAFIHFDTFLSELPAGVQLFSLFNANPHLLELIALIMGSAPAMAESLSKNPNLLDTVLTADFFRDLPDSQTLFSELSNLLLLARDFEDEMDIVRRFKNEKQFQAGVQLIRHQVTTYEASRYLSDIADVSIQALLHRVEVNFAAKTPELQMGGLAVIALGRLGAGELTFGSDIDLIFVYDTEIYETMPSANAGDLYNKLSQRFISALTSLTREGRLYTVDTRLRPSGMDGALAVSTEAFDKYFREAAWTFELMALTRGRVITGNNDTKQKLEQKIRANILRPHDNHKLVQDIGELRGKITKEFGSDNPWNLKYVRGGLMDLDFLAQYYVLLHAHTIRDIITPSTPKVFDTLILHNLMDKHIGEALIEAHQFLHALFALLRLCGGGILNEALAPQGLKHLLADSLELFDFAAVKAELLATLQTVYEIWQVTLEPSQPT